MESINALAILELNWSENRPARSSRKGAGEILLTSIDRDGTMKGYDVDLVKTISDEVNVPVIASGGAGSYDHMSEVILKGGASAVAAASMFHFTEQTPAQAKFFLQSKNIPVRTNFKEL